jgi:protease-4
VDENGDTREIPQPATPWDAPPAEGGGSSWGSPPPAIPTASRPSPGKRPRKRTGLVILIVAAVGLVLLVGLVALAGMGYVQMAGMDGSPLGNLVQYTEEEGSSSDRIMIVKVGGVIAESKGCAPAVIAQLRRLRKKEQPARVKGLIIWVNSPGGSVTPCDVIDNEIQLLKKQGIKVTAFYDGVAASGGYYVSARADHIVARPTCITGSIGVIMVSLNAEKLLKDKLGLEAESITSVPYKDVPSMFRSMKPEEREYMQKFINDTHKRFLSVVKEGRNLNDEQVAKFANGKIYLADDALRLKMIDEVGHLDEAIAAARKLVGSEATVIGYRRRPSPFELMLQSKSPSVIPEDLRLKLEVASRNRACYLWLP